MFFATLSGKNTDSALPLLNILEMLTVANVYRLHAYSCMAQRCFARTASNVHNYSIRYATKLNLHKFRVIKNKYWQTNDLIYGH